MSQDAASRGTRIPRYESGFRDERAGEHCLAFVLTEVAEDNHQQLGDRDLAATLVMNKPVKGRIVGGIKDGGDAGPEECPSFDDTGGATLRVEFY